VPGWFTRSFLTNKAVQSLRINQGPTVTFMWHAKSEAKPQTYSDSHCFIIKPTHMTILALPEASLHCVGMKQPGKKPAVPGCSNWTSLELRLPKCWDDPRRVVWAANRLEEYQKLTTSQRDMTEKSLFRNRHNQQECRPGGRVCLPQTPKKQEVRAKTRLTPRPPSFTGRLA